MNRAPGFTRVKVDIGTVIVFEGKQYLVSASSYDIRNGEGYLTLQPYTHPVEAQLRHALKNNNGNVSHLAMTSGITRDQARALLEKHGLVEFANDLRIAAGGVVTVEGKHEGRVTGRPKTRPKK